MATPFVPVPFPMERARSRVRRTASLGSVSTGSGSPSRAPGDETIPETRGGSSRPCATPPLECHSPVTRTRLNGTGPSMEYSNRPRSHDDSLDSPPRERPVTPTLLGYEIMEERAKFTVYKILVRKGQESWVVFRRYTDFSRLNSKLKDKFPGFSFSLPPKRWFKDNYDTEFLEERQLGLQVFLQNLVARKDIATSLPVREFLCLDDPPGPFDSLEESRAFCETLEETNYRLQKELVEKQREIEELRKALEEKRLHIHILEKRVNGDSLSPESLESPCRLSGSGPGSEGSTEADIDTESSVVEADQEMDLENGCGVAASKKGHTACWCGPLPGSPPPIIQVTQVTQEPQPLT
ncbi:sorting nexin-16-like [Conger conger]|uniref:sorting nexin-16-like n=1 Tax=Conger conger TaxID=82655 RepID=UPI002A59CA0C|nr:sorting nexin-16-like [Conger conger]XP_061112132.1 sorting nexin-16-like [Conger conger]